MNLSYIRPGRWFSRMWLYLHSFADYCIPALFFRNMRKTLMSSLTDREKAEVCRRANYYIRIGEHSHIIPDTTVGTFKFPFGQSGKRTKYFFDLYRVVRYFNPEYSFAYRFGDVTEVPSCPAFVKSRPITSDNTNSVVLKLNQWRHFVFVNDKQPFRTKKNMIVFRNVVRQAHRAKFLELYFGNPLCDIGKTNDDYAEEHPEWKQDFMTMSQQLKYKFIACIEGNDVATNLKWVMSSNSVAVMPRPKYETWFMEATLIPDYHYIEINPDYSNLIERMQYYTEHPEAAEAIIKHAHEYIEKFRNRKIEFAIQLTVADEYFRRTGQYKIN